MHPGSRDGVWVALAATLLVAALLWRFGPVMTPDSGTFVAAAEMLAQPGGWLNAAPLAQDALPWVFYRPPLYPALILAARVVAGASWPWLIVALQLALATAATVAFHRALLGLTGARWWTLLGSIAQAGTFAIATHPAILSDSFYASLLTLALARLLRRGMGEGLGAGDALAVGLLLGAATGLREVGAWLGLLWLPLAAAAAPSGRRISRVALCLLPMLAIVGGLLAWNQARAGAPFLTTVGQVVYLQALLPLAARGLPVFAADPLLAEVAASVFPPFTNLEVVAANRKLFAEHGMQAPALAALASRVWRAAWAAHPLPMALAASNRIKAHHLLTLFLPLENLGHGVLWATETAPLVARFDRLMRTAFATLAPELLALALLLALCRAIAAVLALAWILSLPAALARAGRDPAARLVAAAWPILPATLAAHALVHLEVRYFAPAMPAAIAGAAWWLARLRPWRRTTSGP